MSDEVFAGFFGFAVGIFITVVIATPAGYEWGSGHMKREAIAQGKAFYAMHGDEVKFTWNKQETADE